MSDKKIVHSAFVRFPGLLYDFGLASRRAQVLSVKIEVDTNPPRGAKLTTTVVHRHLALHLQHHDQASLLAGKLHAVLQRPWVKGRDIYDLFWYLGQRSWPEPNVALLGAALKQSGWKGPAVDQQNWKSVLRQRVKVLRWERVVADVQPFLEVPSEADVLTRDNLLGLIA